MAFFNNNSPSFFLQRVLFPYLLFHSFDFVFDRQQLFDFPETGIVISLEQLFEMLFHDLADCQSFGCVLDGSGECPG